MKNFYTTRPNEVERGDVYVVVVKALVDYEGRIRVYRCAWPHEYEPQGDKLYAPMGDDYRVSQTAYHLFPVLSQAQQLGILDEDAEMCEWKWNEEAYKTLCGYDVARDNVGSDWTHCPYCGRAIRLSGDVE